MVDLLFTVNYDQKRLFPFRRDAKALFGLEGVGEWKVEGVGEWKCEDL